MGEWERERERKGCNEDSAMNWMRKEAVARIREVAIKSEIGEKKKVSERDKPEFKSVERCERERRRRRRKEEEKKDIAL